MHLHFAAAGQAQLVLRGDGDFAARGALRAAGFDHAGGLQHHPLRGLEGDFAVLTNDGRASLDVPTIAHQPTVDADVARQQGAEVDGFLVGVGHLHPDVGAVDVGHLHTAASRQQNDAAGCLDEAGVFDPRRNQKNFTARCAAKRPCIANIACTRRVGKPQSIGLEICIG